MIKQWNMVIKGESFRKFIIVSFFLLPSLIGLILFNLVPMASAIGLSFYEWDLLSEPEFIGLANYVNLINDPNFWRALLNILYFIALYLPSVMVIALGIALILNKKLKGIVLFRTAFFIPVVCSWISISLLWKWLWNPMYGLINYILSLIHIQGPLWLMDPNWAMPAIVITSIWKDIGFVMVIFLSGLQAIPEDYYKAADIDGANSWNKFRYITLPLLSPTTFMIITISLINYFQLFDQVWIMTRGGPAGATTVLVEQIIKNAFSYYKMGYATAISCVLFIIIFFLTALQMKIIRGTTYE